MPQLKQSPFKTVLSFYAQKLVPAALGFASLPWLFETTGGAIYGNYSALALLVAACAMLTGTWVSQSALRNFSGAPYAGMTAQHLWQSVLVSAIGAGVLAWTALRWALPHISASPVALSFAVSATTAQLALIPVLQACHWHIAATLAEVIRTSGAIALIVLGLRLGVPPESIIELALLGSSALAIIVMLPACLASIRPSQPDSAAHLQSWARMLTYGAPLSFYNGCAMWLQYFCRAAVIRNFEGAGLLIIGADLALRVVSAIGTPLVASQVPLMMNEYREGRVKTVFKLIKILQLSLLGVGVLLLIVLGSAHAFGWWIFESELVTRCTAIAVISNLIFQLAVCAQKPLELNDKTLSVAIAMAISVLSALWISGFLTPALQHIVPGAELLIAAGALYVTILAFQRRAASMFASGK